MINVISEILQEINQENGSNWKLSVLKKYKDNDLLKRVLKMTYDRVTFTYGIKKLLSTDQANGLVDLTTFLNFIERNIVSREVTGHSALNLLKTQMNLLSKSDQLIARGILNRDLRLNLGRTTINKIWPDLIVKPPYMRCGVYSEKTASKINFPAIIELKADGLAIFTRIDQPIVTCYTRSGEEFILESLQYLNQNDALLGSTIQGEFLIIDEPIRSKSNGLINSLIKYKQGLNGTLSETEATNIENKIKYQVWDLISESDMTNSVNKKLLTGEPYIDRFAKLDSVVAYLAK